MNSNHILLGMFIGVMAISLFTPILSVYGFNQATSMVLLYMLPLVGAATAMTIDSLFADKKENQPVLAEVQEHETLYEMPDIVGKSVHVDASSGSYRGHVKFFDEKIIALENAERLDQKEPSALDNVFIERKDVRKIEVLLEKHEECDVSEDETNRSSPQELVQ